MMFDICELIKMESEASVEKGDGGADSCGGQSQNMTKSLKNATIMLSDNSHESMDKFLQRLEKGVMFFMEHNKLDKLAETIEKYRADPVLATSHYYEIMVDIFKLSLLEERKKMSDRQANLKLTIAVKKLIDQELDREELNYQVLVAALSTVTAEEAATKITEKMRTQKKNTKHSETLLRFAVSYFAEGSHYHHEFKSSLLVNKWQQYVEKYHISLRIKDENVNQILFAMLNCPSIPIEDVVLFATDFSLPKSRIFNKFLRHHLLGEEGSSWGSTKSSALMRADSMDAEFHKVTAKSSWSNIRKRLAALVQIQSQFEKDITLLLQEAYHCIDEHDYEKIEFVLEQMLLLKSKGFGVQGLDNVLGSLKLFKNYS